MVLFSTAVLGLLIVGGAGYYLARNAPPKPTPPKRPNPFEQVAPAMPQRTFPLPTTVTILQPVEMPIIFEGKTLGSATIPANKELDLIEELPETLRLGFKEGSVEVPKKDTDWDARIAKAKAEAEAEAEAQKTAETASPPMQQPNEDTYPGPKPRQSTDGSIFGVATYLNTLIPDKTRVYKPKVLSLTPGMYEGKGAWKVEVAYSVEILKDMQFVPHKQERKILFMRDGKVVGHE